jgi:RNA polymerase sigma-70 factor (ECF subfamily)
MDISQEECLELIEKCKKKCRNSEERLYKILKNTIHSVCRKYAGDQQEAEDIAQECFIKVFTKIGEYRGDGSFQGWVRRIAVNLSITEYTKRRKIGIHDDIERKFDIQDDSFRKMDFGCTHDEIVQFIGDLPKGYGQVLKLYFLDGYKHKEISKMLGISTNTSKTQLLRARNVIRKNMEKKGYFFNF